MHSPISLDILSSDNVSFSFDFPRNPLRHIRATFKADKDKESFGHYKLILGPKMALLWHPKSVFLAD